MQPAVAEIAFRPYQPLVDIDVTKKFHDYVLGVL